MIYTIERIRALADISHIALADGEAERLQRELNGMHALAETLQGTPLEEEMPDPFSGAVSLSALREDTVGDCLSTEALLPADEHGNRYFTVPRTVRE